MRFVGLIVVVLCAPSFAQELNINGYSKVVVPRTQGALFDADVALREAARVAGFEVHGSVEEIPREGWSTTLYMIPGVADYDRLEFAVAVFDVATQTQIAYCTRSEHETRRRHVPGRGVGFEVLVNNVITQLVEDLGYEGFRQSAQEANWQIQKLVLASPPQSTSAEIPASPGKPRMSCRAALAPGSETD
jgi:hypothetical protein